MSANSLNGPLINVHLNGALGKKFGPLYKCYVSSPGEAIRMLCSQFEGFAQYMADPDRQRLYKVYVGGKAIHADTQLHELSGEKDIRITPVAAGAKNGGLFQVVLGAALIGLAFWTGGASMAAWTGTSGAFATGMFGAGVSMMLGGIAQLLSPQPKLNMHEAPNNTPNTSLGVVNTSAQSRPVPIIYGEVMAGSAVISAGIVTQ